MRRKPKTTRYILMPPTSKHAERELVKVPDMEDHVKRWLYELCAVLMLAFAMYCAVCGLYVAYLVGPQIYG